MQLSQKLIHQISVIMSVINWNKKSSTTLSVTYSYIFVLNQRQFQPKQSTLIEYKKTLGKYTKNVKNAFLSQIKIRS